MSTDDLTLPTARSDSRLNSGMHEPPVSLTDLRFLGAANEAARHVDAIVNGAPLEAEAAFKRLRELSTDRADRERIAAHRRDAAARHIAGVRRDRPRFVFARHGNGWKFHHQGAPVVPYQLRLKQLTAGCCLAWNVLHADAEGRLETLLAHDFVGGGNPGCDGSRKSLRLFRDWLFRAGLSDLGAEVLRISISKGGRITYRPSGMQMILA
jgi:hypothetical protein